MVLQAKSKIVEEKLDMESAKKCSDWIGSRYVLSLAEFGTLNEMSRFVLICWSIWNGINNLIFRGVKDSCDKILDRAIQLEANYNFIRHSPMEDTRHASNNNFWTPPPSGFLKVNVDASVVNNSKHFGIGIVGKDSLGNVVFAEGRLFVWKSFTSSSGAYGSKDWSGSGLKFWLPWMDFRI